MIQLVIVELVGQERKDCGKLISDDRRGFERPRMSNPQWGKTKKTDTRNVYNAVRDTLVTAQKARERANRPVRF